MIRRGFQFLCQNSLFLIGGAVLALWWANSDEEAYHHFLHMEIFAGFTFHFLVSDMMMAIFFGIAAKEVWEAFLPKGPLSSWRTAATPLLATCGGVIAPAAIYAAGAYYHGSFSELGRGWAVPTATDIAFSAMVARFIFGGKHPAVTFLLLLAIVDDAIGLGILAVFYPQQELQLQWLVLSALAVVIGFLFRRMKLLSFWWYLLLPGVLSWLAFYKAGIHAALALVPIIPTMPHAHSDAGIFAVEERGRKDTLNEFEHWWMNPTQLILGLFGLVNAGVVFSNTNFGTALVLGALVVGKPLGITLFALLGKPFGLTLPKGMGASDLIVLGTVAGIGFTVALFVSVAAFPAGGVQDGVKMGALASLGAAIVACVMAKMFRIERVQEAPDQTELAPQHEVSLVEV